MLAILTGISQTWGSILNKSASIKYKLFNLMEKINPIPSLEKLDEGRPENRFDKLNPGISAL
jgi:hypothetical protein